MKFKIQNLKSGLGKENIPEIPRLWRENESKILKDIHLLTGLYLKTDKIACYIDGSTSHGYYGGKNITLGVRGGINKDDALMVITHELFHVYYWRKIKRMKLTKSSPGNESKSEWKLAETTAFLLTNEPSLKRYWPKAKVYVYPETKSVHRQVKRFWKTGDIKYFLINSYNKIKSEKCV